MNYRAERAEVEGHRSNDGRVDLTDGVSVLAQLFLGDPAPPPPFKKYGTDPTPDSLNCRLFGMCL
jgi:hypothetical protein